MSGNNVVSLVVVESRPGQGISNSMPNLVDNPVLETHFKQNSAIIELVQVRTKIELLIIILLSREPSFVSMVTRLFIPS